MFKYFFTVTQIPLGKCPEGIYLDNKVILFQDFLKNNLLADFQSDDLGLHFCCSV